MRRLLLGVLLAALPSLAAQAQSLVGALEWLPPGSLSVESLTRHPQEQLAHPQRPGRHLRLG